MPGQTPFQTVGPYLRIGLRAGLGPMTRVDGGGTPMVVTGRLLDGAGQGIPDGLLEFWAPGFAMAGRVWTEDDGNYRLETLVPEGYEDGGAAHAPHFAVRVMGRGILTQYITRMYLDGHPANAYDPVLQQVPAGRRATLMARVAAGAGYHFDVVVQGQDETVFFDL